MGVAPSGPATGNIITVANPVAGAQFQYTVLANTTIHLVAAYFTFTCALAAADRHLGLTVDDGQDVYYISSFALPMQSGNASNICFAPHHHATAFTTNLATMLSLSPFLIIPAGHRINSEIYLIDAADQISNIRLQTQRYVA